MTELAARTVCAAENLFVKDDSAAYARAERDCKEYARVAAVGYVFAVCRGVRVIFENYRDIVVFLELIAERRVIEFKVV